jgi:dienelactone hydrolase
MKAVLRRLWCLLLLLPLAALAQAISKHEEFVPKSGKGPVVIVISGSTGLPYYWEYARQVSDLGYYTVLIDGKDILTRERDGAANLRAVIAKAQASPQGTAAKAALIGFSQGGGAVLAHGAVMDDVVAAVVAYYPATSWARNPAALGARVRVPVLVLAGELDRQNNCCLVGSMREIESGARERGRPLELVVYRNSGHGFNLGGRGYQPHDTEDAWRRTKEMLAKHQPLL